MRIGIDVMGGDNAPHAMLDGAQAAIEHLQEGDRLVLFGDGDVIEAALADVSDRSWFEVVATTEVVATDEGPVDAVRNKPDSSLVSLCRAAGRREEDPLGAVISAGNTGAFVAASQMHMRRLPHVHRPGIAAPVPTFAGPVVFIDVGANILPKPTHLCQYGIMGKVFARRILGIENPRVALMNVGGEEQKGTDDLKQARDMLRAVDGLNFTGFIEGRALFDGGADVVITDGIVGNVSIKLAEGLSSGLIKKLASEIAAADEAMAAAFEPIIRRLYAEYDYHEYGGAPLLGVNGICLIAHGSSEARTIANAVKRAHQFADSGVNGHIVEQLEGIEEEVEVA